MTSIRGCETRLKSRRLLVGVSCIVFAVSCSICTCLMPMVIESPSSGAIPSCLKRIMLPSRANGSAMN